MRILLFSCLLSFVISACSEKDKGMLIFTEPTSGQEFNFPYFLYIPEQVDTIEPLTLLVEPNNSGFVDDDFQKHVEKAKRTASLDFYTGNYASRQLQLPLLVPVFPRSKSNWKMYTHALDRDAILEKGTALERIDVQLLAMVEDAKKKLYNMGYSTREKFLLTGFSASGTFVNRFTLIHPEKVLGVAAGGLNGLLILPQDTLEQKELIYPVGTGDFELLFNHPFDSVAFQNTPQFLFMGELDNNDAIPYNDGYDEPERTLIYEVLSEEMMPARWNKCVTVYQQNHVNARIKIYKGIGHEQPVEVKDEVVDFFRSCLSP